MARRIVAPPPPPATPDRIASLQAAIVTDPDDTDSYLVLADALIEAGDPRGELIVAQHQGVAKRDRELTERFGGEISTLAGVPVQLEWRLGFVWRCSVDLRSALDEPVGQLGAALGHPCMQLLHGLVVRCAMHRGPDVISAIGARTRPNLRALALDEELGDWDEGRVDRATAALWSQLPNLESLRLRSERALFDRIDHPRVRRMWLEVAPFSEGFQWNLPALESLLERNGGVMVGGEVSYVDLSTFQIFVGLEYAFPHAMNKVTKETPKLLALRDRIARRPKLGAYLASKRRLPFNQQGIFRHYKELDPA